MVVVHFVTIHDQHVVHSTSDKYLSDFVLHGTTQKDFSENLYEDLKAVIKVRLHPFFAVQ